MVGAWSHDGTFCPGVFSLADCRHGVLVHRRRLYRVDLGDVGEVRGIVERSLSARVLQDHRARGSRPRWGGGSVGFCHRHLRFDGVELFSVGV